MKSTLMLKLILLLATCGGLVSDLHAQPKPDLIVTGASISKQKRGDTVYQVTVNFTVTNYCQGTGSPKTGILLQFYGETDPGKETLVYVTDSGIPALVGGGVNYLTTIKINKDHGSYWLKGDLFFKWLNQSGKLPRVRLTVDHPKIVKEADELNNWWELNPDKSPPKLSGQFQCSPKV